MIKCYEEKKYITALWVKQVDKGATPNNLIKRWKNKWDDSVDEATAKEIIEWCKTISNGLTYRELLALRTEHADRTQLLKDDKKIIQKKNLQVIKGSSVHHPGSLTGYMICDSAGNCLAGVYYDMSYTAMKKFIKRYQ